jgi:hypothetical protein
MEDLFAKFIDEEFECIFSDEDNVDYAIEDFDDERLTSEKFYKHFDEFKEQVVDMTSNDEWLIQQIHERMDDMLRDVLKEYLNNYQ